MTTHQGGEEAKWSGKKKRKKTRGARDCMRKVPKLHLEFYQRDITDGALSPWKLPVGVVSESFLEVVKVAQVQPVVGPIFHSSAMEDVDHDVWRALLTEIRQRGAHALNCSVTLSAWASSSSHELPKESRAKVEPGSGKHSVCTHYFKDPNCDICLKTKK